MANSPISIKGRLRFKKMSTISTNSSTASIKITELKSKLPQ